MAESSGPPIGLLANGAAFVPPEYYNLPGFGYANLQAQMADAMQNWQKGAGAFAGNNVPKFNGQANATFGGGFANMQPNVGGGLLGASAYSGGFNPFAGRGNGPPAGGGTTPPPGGSAPPPGGSAPPPGGTYPGQPTPTPGTSPVPTNPLPPTTPLPGTAVPPRVRDPAAGGAPVNPGTPKGLLSGQTPQQPYSNTFEFPNSTQTTKTASGKEVPNPFGLTTEQIYFALSGDPEAIRRLSESLGATGGQTMQNGQLVMSPENQKFHQIVNYYASGGGAFNTGYTPEDAFNAAKNYSLGKGETTYQEHAFTKGTPVIGSDGKIIGYATGVGQGYTPV